MHKRRERVLIDCKCGQCGLQIENYDKKGRPRSFISGHNIVKGHKKSEETKKKMSERNKGRIVSEETRKKLSETLKGKKLMEKNGFWKGDLVGYVGLHAWITTRLPKPEFCEICKKVPPLDLSNKSGNYLRNLTDWQWVCKKCHYHYDNIGEKMWKTRRKNMMMVTNV